MKEKQIIIIIVILVVLLLLFFNNKKEGFTSRTLSRSRYSRPRMAPTTTTMPPMTTRLVPTRTSRTSRTLSRSRYTSVRMPTTMAPTTFAPTTFASTTIEPTTFAPTTMAPTTFAPTTIEPPTFAPTTMAPTTTSPPTKWLWQCIGNDGERKDSWNDFGMNGGLYNTSKDEARNLCNAWVGWCGNNNGCEPNMVRIE